jgi:squalene synthase HpnC/squalene synthase HpnD
MQVPAELEIARELPAPGCSREEAERYTRRLATSHYENFNVVSWLLPRRLHQHFYNVYAYCRWADDLGDEVPDPARALALLDEWEGELEACYAGRPSHPVFVALAPTVRDFDIPIEPFRHLLRAFRQDQTVHRYPDWEALLDYCRYSANPVGRLVLYLCGYRDPERQRLADATCTALQLANFWQDVSRDLDKGRIYIPLDRLAAHRLSEADVLARRFDERYRGLMQELVARTRELFAAGQPLVQRVSPELRVDIEMFSRGGLAVLDAIERSGYNTLAQRPALRRSTQAGLLGRALVSRLFASLAPADTEAARPSGADAKNAAPEVAASYEFCRRMARSSGSNFYYAFFLLPREKRRAFYALYSFMRQADDISDRPGDAAQKLLQLAEFRRKLLRAVGGEFAENPVLPALADALRRYGIPVRYLDELLEGAEMDQRVTSYGTFEQLRGYCYRVAGTVGIICTHVFGFREPRALELAERLGLAFQLTNILRDLGADLETGRCYLPEEDLARFGVSRAELERRELTAAIRELLAFEAGRAWSFYDEGAGLLPMIEADSRPALSALVGIYSRLLAEIERRGFDVFAEPRARVSRAAKLGILLRARWTGRWNSPREERAGHRRGAGGTVLGRRAG